MRKSKILSVIFILSLLAGVCLLLYPWFSNYWNSFRATRVISSSAQQLTGMDQETYDKILEDAHQFNEDLRGFSNRFFPTEAEHERYLNTLNIDDGLVMGDISIPKIHVALPIYHGTDEGTLRTGIGHLEGSSLPVGGESTHAVLSGHCGLPSARLLTDLDQLVPGDTFEIHVLREVYTYEVDGSQVVTPDETAAFDIVPGEDVVTLVTCTPYGVNTHRLLVHAHRIETPESSYIKVPPNEAISATTFYRDTVILIVAACGIIALITAAFVIGKKSGRKNDETN